MTSFHQLYQRYAQDVYRFAFWLSGSTEEAEDVTSETFLRAWTAGDIRVETVKAYLLAIARNLCLQRMRSRGRQVGLDNDRPDPAPGPDRVLEERSELEDVMKALATLPEPTRTALLLHAVQGLSHAEIGRSLGISVGAVKVRIHRARIRLQAALAEKEVHTP
jgi:RNA polymerase sigma factor (sigma-70 family)